MRKANDCNLSRCSFVSCWTFHDDRACTCMCVWGNETIEPPERILGRDIGVRSSSCCRFIALTQLDCGHRTSASVRSFVALRRGAWRVLTNWPTRSVRYGTRRWHFRAYKMTTTQRLTQTNTHTRSKLFQCVSFFYFGEYQVMLENNWIDIARYFSTSGEAEWCPFPYYQLLLSSTNIHTKSFLSLPSLLKDTNKWWHEPQNLLSFTQKKTSTQNHTIYTILLKLRTILPCQGGFLDSKLAARNNHKQ